MGGTSSRRPPSSCSRKRPWWLGGGWCGRSKKLGKERGMVSRTYFQGVDEKGKRESNEKEVFQTKEG